ncbi:PolC-type DNA polymerase III [Dysgonomonas sp. GY617]|uniref:3'-5' exonuclease n=1 Tax=Dysgonomonas sp. GY617 TaxID=2780420 RepID=UPI00188407CE|nr:exonuclease domain-containing protein [Dysgonomonas sp. GY617]MBF0575523.1 3'-5' exonuclease [Dysgonomonas sp. GY617]
MAAPQTEIKIYTGIGLDFETGGLDSTKHACTQLAMQAVRLDTWDVTDRYVKYIAPYDKQNIGGPVKRKVLKNKRELEAGQMEYEQAALVYSGITMELLLNKGADLKEVATETIEFVKRNTLSKGTQCKPVLIGQNITFDVSFLQQLMNYTRLTKEFEKVFSGTKDFYGNFQPHYIDTIDLARLCYADDASVASYKLELIAERLGIELDDAHDADADVTATLNIARVCSNRLRSDEGGMGVSIQKAEKTRNYFKI